MKKIKYFFVIMAALISFQSCGFKPIYSSENLNINFIKIDYEKNNLNKKVVRTLKNFSNPNADKFYEVKLETLKNRKVISKNSKGNAETYELKITLNLDIFNEKNNFARTFVNKLNYKDNVNKFQLKQYESEVEKQILNDIIKDVLVFLSDIK